MAYLTRGLLKAAVGGDRIYQELTDDDGDGIADTDVEDFLLAEVDTIANGYLRRGGYLVPITDANDITELKPFLLSIANYKARSRGGREASEDDRKQYDDAIKVLAQIAEGELKLPSFQSAAPIGTFGFDSGGDLASSTASSPFFSRRTLRGF